MDRKKLEAALERLEDEKFGRTLNLPGVDPAVIGAWFRWLRDTPGLDLERLRTRANRQGEQGERNGCDGAPTIGWPSASTPTTT